MFISLQTNEGKRLDAKNVKYMTFDNVEYALFPVLPTFTVMPKKKIVLDETVNKNLDEFFDVKKTKKVQVNSVAHKVRQWLSTAKIGESMVIKAPTDYAIRVACETRGVKAKIFKQKRGQYRVVFDAKKKYARQKGV